MNSAHILIFSLLIALGVASILTILFAAYMRRQQLTNMLERPERRSNIFSNLSNVATSFFSGTSHEISEKLIGAGIYNTAIAPYYFLLKYTICGIGVLVILLKGDSLGVVTIQDKVIYLSLLILSVVILPDLYLEFRRRSLALKLTRKLPYLLDMMGVCVQTGMTIESTLFYLTTEMAAFDRDMAFMLKRLRDRAQTMGLEKALQELYDRIPSPEMHSFVMTLTQSMQHGTSIYKVLSTLAKDIREIQLLSLEEKAGKLSSKMSVPLIIFIMIPIVILITAPGIMRIMGV
ncbi:biotin synthase [Enterovibrio norvegicus]|uniref:type II secretion system F family protein n=1 Tax=Enterovibrio norvegicus TaxID=188144 RepID=UPI000C8577DB|nr:type II secretion system F family protein [Enterovibrio norvegicus]MCC4797727.1 type II secretion system F family protein [Enterovibrio norvegicus]PMH61028.1 biotin synthase [Enterovibrio norvegicus]PMI32743.1 biotin synthase [Enterovibrio norvegicus]PMI38815.1 biotin synthase [Enterovibrio norvegicus]PMN45566.1 biotin synthase [Enterovibrio norvegicus]